MLTAAAPFDLASYAAEVGLPDAGRRDLEYIAGNEPGRVVRSSPFNAAGRYWSRKNQAATQFESVTLERPYLVLLEFDPDVRRCYDQPPIQITFIQRDPDGTTFPITLKPDFAVCRRTRVEIVDCMRAEELSSTAEKHPGYYIQDEDGRWHCPAAEAWAAERGFVYRIVTESDIDKTVVRNWLSLSDAAAAEPPAEELRAPVLDRVAREPGVTLGVLAREGVSMAVVKWAIATGRLYVDLTRHVIDDPDHTPIYPSRDVALVLEPQTPASWAIGSDAPDVVSFEVGTRLLWGESVAEIVAAGPDRIWLRTSARSPVEFDREAIEALWRSGSVRSLPDDRPNLLTASADVALDRYRRGGRPGLEAALKRLGIVEAFERGKTDPADRNWSVSVDGRRLFGGVTPETIEEWIRERRRVQAVSGDRLAGLVPALNPGNRTSRLDPRTEAIILAVAKDLYATADRRTIRSVALEIRRQCRAARLAAPHPRTVRERLKKLPLYETARRRLGDSAAYALEPFTPIDPDAPLPNGAYPNQVLHIDHTIVDQETIDPETQVGLGRLGLSRGFDGCTGRECVHLWSYDQASRSTIPRILLRYAERFGRLPEVIVLDKDPAHRSVELLAFCEAFGITLLWRRTRKGRDGWRVERPFGTLNHDLFYALTGNTQASRNPRQLTKDNNPRLRTVWDLVQIDRRYREVRDARDERFDPILGKSPREAWDEGIAVAGVGRRVRVDDRFRFLAMPYADGVTRLIHPTKGVVVKYLRYEAPEFGDPEVAYQRAEVRIDPDDASRVVVLIAGRYIVARCRAIAHFRVISRNELALLSERIRRDEQLASRLQATFETALAEILASARDWETTQRALQAKAIRTAAEAEQAATSHSATGAAADSPTDPDPEPISHYWERQWAGHDVEEVS